MMFWKDYYLNKGPISLWERSRIHFSEWLATVNTLISDDETLPTSILHYVDDDDDL